MSVDTHALYPISGDPPTWAHLDILQRASKLYSKITWGLGVNHLKPSFLPQDLRLAMMKDCLQGLNLAGVTVAYYQGATANFASDIGANVLIRGLRTTSDLENEMQLAYGNRLIVPNLETALLFCRPEYSLISSSLAREMALLDAPLHKLLPEKVAQRMRAYIKEQSPAKD